MFLHLTLCLTIILGQAKADLSTTISVQLDTPAHHVDEDFLSVTIDAGSIYHNWSDIDFTSTKILNMAKALTPIMLRVGGTYQDYLLFTNPTNMIENVYMRNFTMSASQWDAVNNFVKAVNWKFIFGLNQLLRDSNGDWDPTNAKELISYTLKKGYIVAWELGNEPNLYYLDMPSPLTAQQVANGFYLLKSILTDMKYPAIFIAGPDVASAGGSYMNSFLAAIKGHSVINAATWHQYYGSSATAKLNNFYNITILDGLYGVIDEVVGIANSQSFTGDLWLGETSSTYGGGTQLYSQCYISGFMWLDKLGIAAYTQKKVFRQDFVGNNYALLDSNQNPLPDYWLSVIYKKLVGTQVLFVKGALDKGRNIRVYAHCAKTPYAKGTVVFLILNINNNTASIILTNKELIDSQRDVYWLTSTNITSQSVSLNGVLLQLNGNELPDILPLNQPSSVDIKLAPLSFGYVVFKTANVEACQ